MKEISGHNMFISGWGKKYVDLVKGSKKRR
jgi:hypothetical protein